MNVTNSSLGGQTQVEVVFQASLATAQMSLRKWVHTDDIAKCPAVPLNPVPSSSSHTPFFRRFQGGVQWMSEVESMYLEGRNDTTSEDTRHSSKESWTRRSTRASKTVAAYVISLM